MTTPGDDVAAGPAATPGLVSVAVVDEVGVRGSGTEGLRWDALGVAPPGDSATLRALTGQGDRTFRRLGRLSRTVVLAGAALDLDTHLRTDDRDETAVVLETSRGVLETDRMFLASMARGEAEGPLFPGTLPSACVGELARRHHLRGPSFALCTEAPGDGEALREARRLLKHGEARFVVAGCAEVSGSLEGTPDLTTRAVLVLLSRDFAAFDPGPAGTPPWDALAIDPQRQ